MVRANDRLRQQWKQAPAVVRGRAMRVQHGMAAVVDQRPVELTLLAFGMGLTLGVGMGLLMTESFLRQPGMGMRSTASALSRVLPESLARHFQ
jgi:hypothetical protein